MASGDPRQASGNPGDQTAGQMVPYRGNATPMELNGNGGGVTDSQHGERENRPAQLLLRHVGAVATEAARRATLFAVAEWSNSAGQQQNAALRGMGEALGQQLEAASNQAVAQRLQQASEL